MIVLRSKKMHIDIMEEKLGEARENAIYLVTYPTSSTHDC